jgi:hemin uptake protein HemP
MGMIINNRVTCLPEPPPMTVHRLSLPASAPRPAPAPQPSAQEEVFTSDTLLQGRREILIRHGDKLYRLRHTSNDKLILTK